MDEVLDVALELIRPGEGLCLRAYPDPASPLYAALSRRNILRKYMQGQAEIPDDLRELSGKPWTIGYGETKGIREGMVWTKEYADERLRVRVRQFMREVLHLCPQLWLEPPTRLAACVSLAYNIGSAPAFVASSVCRLTKYREYQRAADSFRLWNKAGGKVMKGLVHRRELERAYYLK